MNTTEFCQEHKITATATQVDSNPNWQVDQSQFDHWKVKLSRGRSSMTTFFSCGFWHEGRPPKVDTVIDALVSEGYVGQTFEEYCGDFGMNTDSIKALQAFKSSQRQLKKLLKFLGDDLFYALSDAERL